jgi:hypothetical protein
VDWSLVIAWIALAVALVSLSGTIYAVEHRNPDPDLDELSQQVLSLRKSHRAEQMRRVRETARDTPPHVEPDGAAGPFPAHDPMARVSKEQLRKMAGGIDFSGRQH